MDQTFSSLRYLLLRNSIEALEDVATVLASRTKMSVSACHFLTSYEFLIQASPEARRKILDDPRFRIWIKTVETTLLASDNLIPRESDVMIWSDNISVLALSAALIDGVSYQTILQSPLRGITFLPGVRYYFICHGRSDKTSLSTTSDGSLTANGVNASLYPIPEWGGFQLVSTDSLLNPPDSSDITRLNESEVARQDWPDLLEKASSLIALHPPSLELSRCFGSIIVPVQAEAENIHCSVSFSNRPYVLYMSWAPLVHVIAEAIIHESDHQLFYLLTRHADFWKEPVETQPCIFRSPWRDDPRPLDGLLRGASAFIRVGEFWDAIRHTFVYGTNDFNWAGRRTTLAARQSIDAISVIKHHGLLSTQGQEIILSLEDRARFLLESLSDELDFDSWKKTAIEKEVEHDKAWRERHRANEKDRLKHE